MNPKYGSDIRSYLFEPLDYGTAAQIKANIQSTIDRFEPRISISDIKCIPNFNDNGFDVEMTYIIRGSDEPPVTVDIFLERTR